MKTRLEISDWQSDNDYQRHNWGVELDRAEAERPASRPRNPYRYADHRGPEPISELFLALFFWALAAGALGVMAWLMAS